MKQLNWEQTEGTQKEKPLELEIGITTVYLRRNIERTPKEDGDQIIFVWRYEEAQLTPEEYAEYQEDTEKPSIQGIMQQISGIQAEQEMQSIAQDSNTEIIMQTLSDIQADIALLQEV